MHALIIEDDAIVALGLQQDLAKIGFQSFAIAADEQEAVEAANTRPPDLISADVRLRTGSGIDAVRRIRESWQGPVVFVTGNEHLLAGKKEFFVAKPFESMHYRSVCLAALGRFGRA